METQIARGYKALTGTKAEMEAADNVGGGMMWWATDENALYVYGDAGWQLSKATQSGTTVERLAYTPIFIGEVWWDTTLEQLFIWDGSVWDDVAVAHAGTTVEKDAYAQDTGDLWWDTTKREWYVDAGSNWQTISPSLVDTFARLPSLLHFITPNGTWYGTRGYSFNTENINVSLYTSGLWRETRISKTIFGEPLALYAWTRPMHAVNDAALINEWNWEEPDEYFYSLEQNDSVFSFGISDDGIRANRYYVETPYINNINESWHFLAGVYDPGNSIKLFHNGTWYEYSGAVPVSRYYTPVVGLELEFNCKIGYSLYWAALGVCVTVPSEEIVELVYYNTRGLFL